MRRMNRYTASATSVVILVIAVLLVAAVAFLGPVVLIAVVATLSTRLIYKLYEHIYFKSERFNRLRYILASHIDDCNELNEHIEGLKAVDLGASGSGYGFSDFHDASRWNYSRPGLASIETGSNVHPCSRSVCEASRRNPIQYVCKYFGFAADEETLEMFEQMLNDFTAVEDGKESLAQQKAEIMEQISDEIPSLIRKHSEERFWREIGLQDIDFSTDYFPRFLFQYVSPGGNASLENSVVMDIANLNQMVEYLNGRIKWRKSVAGQRALMTSGLRRSILRRDGYTCQRCGVSMREEPHLLLEVDHIVPLSRGGLTTVDNLQTLCWRCNRRKGSRLA